jgi:hypothetical protein
MSSLFNPNPGPSLEPMRQQARARLRDAVAAHRAAMLDPSPAEAQRRARLVAEARILAREPRP